MHVVMFTMNEHPGQCFPGAVEELYLFAVAPMATNLTSFE